MAKAGLVAALMLLTMLAGSVLLTTMIATIGATTP